MGGRVGFFRERVLEVLAQFPVPDSKMRFGEWVPASEAHATAEALTAAVNAAEDGDVERVVDRAVATLIGVSVGRDPTAGGMCGNPVNAVIAGHAGTGAGRVLLVLVELYAELERPISAAALMSVFSGATAVADSQRKVQASDLAEWQRSGG